MASSKEGKKQFPPLLVTSKNARKKLKNNPSNAQKLSLANNSRLFKQKKGKYQI